MNTAVASRPTRPIRLYRHPLSGHAHRAELFLSLLDLPVEPIDVDLLRGEQKRPEFLARNVFGQVPVIEDGEATVADSNAILVYLALRYDTSGRWLPREPLAAAEVQRWLSIAAGPLAAGPAQARISALFGRPLDPRSRELAAQLFQQLDTRLAAQPWLVPGESPTLADIALYSYTAHAPEGGVPLAPYPHLQAWLARIKALPGFVGMRRSPALA
ncbi:glutathione S-transferase [Aquabacterium sp. A7-Y]|uniref:glutathione S-transferase family protein n=1 Tax=Aquabacterium sp. A7-Y TaxID=1349605 RepID=UPI00223C8F99|nr:glutathione S-transferase [Aquabacterium sp. A7-Y]MCW7538366.1 glutathione S-transferase [Aquabacterium sp. A7-Y]